MSGCGGAGAQDLPHAHRPVGAERGADSGGQGAQEVRPGPARRQAPSLPHQGGPPEQAG